MSDGSCHIEYLNPYLRRMFILRVIIIVVLSVAILFYIIYNILLYNYDTNDKIRLFLLLFFLLFVPLMSVLIKEALDIYDKPSKGAKYLGKIYIDDNIIEYSSGKILIKSIEWKEVVLIERFRENNSNYLLIMHKNILGKEVKDGRYINYIEIPSRMSIDQAITRFSKTKIVNRNMEN